MDGWTTGPVRVDPGAYAGAALGNGMLGLVSSPHPFRVTETVLNGAWEPRFPGETACLVSSFDILGVGFEVDFESIERAEQVADFEQSIDYGTGVLTSTFTVRGQVVVTHRMRVLRQLEHVALAEVRVEALEHARLSVLARLAPPAATIPWGDGPAAPALRALSTSTSPPVLVASAEGPTGMLRVAAAQTVVAGSAGLGFTRELQSGEVVAFAVLGATLSTAHTADPVGEVERIIASAVRQGVPELTRAHDAAWRELWLGDIRVEGDERIQLEVRAMLHLLYASVRAGSRLSIPPMGLTQTYRAYRGHIFWDAETWMLPALVVLHPELARSMLDYRVDRLAAAEWRASGQGYRGAMFPWESAATGAEETPPDALSGPLEHHITADIAIAAWTYFQVTQDAQWLRKDGYRLIAECAAFWTSRVDRSSEIYSIRGVVGADEYAEHVDDDAFTNAAAREALVIATRAAGVLGLDPDPDWEHVRARIPILRFADGTTREHATYDGERIKQADVNLLAFPLTEVVDEADIRRDIDYYLPRVDGVGGPAMTKSVLAVLRARLGQPDEALRVFLDGYRPIARPPFGAIAESAAYPNAHFVTAAGGMVQTLLFGFGGLRITEHGVEHRPGTRLPRGWSRVILTGIGRERATHITEAR